MSKERWPTGRKREELRNSLTQLASTRQLLDGLVSVTPSHISMAGEVADDAYLAIQNAAGKHLSMPRRLLFVANYMAEQAADRLISDGQAQL